MAQVDTNDIRTGMKLQIDKEPYTVVGTEFVKPGKGQAFARIKLKHLLSGRVVEKTYRTGEKFEMSDVEERKMRLLYTEADSVVFMDDENFDQVTVPSSVVADTKDWLKEDIVYDVIFYNGNIVAVSPPTFMELTITQTDPGIRGDTASGRVLKPAILETGAKVQIPIFVEQDEKIKVDTRNGEYVSRI